MSKQLALVLVSFIVLVRLRLRFKCSNTYLYLNGETGAEIFTKYLIQFFMCIGVTEIHFFFYNC